MATFRIGAAIVIGLATLWGAATAAGTEFNPVPRPVSIGPEANRIIVGFAVTAANAAEFEIAARVKSRARSLTEARTHGADVAALALRTRLAVARSRQLTPDMHVLFLPHTLYGAAIVDALERLRRDPAVKFADIDQRRFPLNVPDDPLFEPTAGASGQWYMEMPNAAITVDGVQTMDLSATNAVSAWNITTGSSGIVIADIDTGVRFDHPDLLRGGLGGRLLPGYDFVGEDYNATTGAALGTYLRANDGDGWDPDPSDPGDWVSSTDQLNAVFPESDCPVANSSWHGTRVVGIFGAITNNGVGIAGMSWGALLLPVRALGKCGGYDSDIITGIEWAAGMPVNGTDEPTVPVNPFPADIINVSLGGSGACASDYQNALATVTGLGVLVVASAGNSATDVTTNSSVESPANCSALVPGIIAVAGLRNVGTKVGYSSLGPEVGVSAPAGNCIDAGGACLRSIDTTTNLGATGPAQNSYTNETDNNLGTSFAAPIVSGIAALMRSVNANLGPAQLVARLESSARAFPADSTGLAICPNLDPTTEECACPPSGQCGSGMVDALAAVVAAQRPIAAIALPAAFGGGAVLDASGSAAACGRQIAGYAWSAAGGVSITSGAAAAKVTVQPSSGSGTISLTVTDSEGAVDSATVSVAGGAATSSAPASAGAGACPSPRSVTPAPPVVSEAFSPASVGESQASTLTITVRNPNGFALTESNFTETLPAGLNLLASPAPATSCTGALSTLTTATNTVTLSGGIVPADASCTLTLAVSSATAATYANGIDAAAFMTGPAGANAAPATASLSVNAPSGGGGALHWPEIWFLGASWLAHQRTARRRPRTGYFKSSC